MKILDASAFSLPAAAAALPVAAANDDAAYRARAQRAAEQFESYFIAQMMKEMRRSTRELAGDDAVFKDRVNDDMLALADGLVADALSGQRAFGVADAILRQLLPPAGPPATPALNEPARAVAQDSLEDDAEPPRQP